MKNNSEHDNAQISFILFLSKGTPAPLNIPTPTPAPDRGGPVACLGGPVACLSQDGASRIPIEN